MGIELDGTPGIDPQVETWATSAARADAIEAKIADMLERESTWADHLLADVQPDSLRQFIAGVMPRMAYDEHGEEWWKAAGEQIRDLAEAEVDDEWKRAGDDVEGWG